MKVKHKFKKQILGASMNSKNEFFKTLKMRNLLTGNFMLFISELHYSRMIDESGRALSDLVCWTEEPDGDRYYGYISDFRDYLNLNPDVNVFELINFPTASQVI